MFRPVLAALAAVLTIAGLVASPASAQNAPPVQALAQTLTWTAGNPTDRYLSAPTTAVAGATTIVFENSEATGNTTSMPHTLTFDTSTPGYNHDVTESILANPQDANGGRHERQVTLTPGKYRYFCTIPGHGQMFGEFTVTGGGDPDTTAPTVTAQVTGEQNADGDYVGSASVAVTATDNEGGSGIASTEYQVDGGAWTAYTAPVVVNTVGDHMVHYRATDVAGNVSQEGMSSFTVVEDGGGEDTTPPTAVAELAGTQDPDGNYVNSVTIEVTATDNDGGSGVASVEYEIDDTGFKPYTEPVTVTAPGDHAVQYRATDVAGNVSETGSTPFRIVEGTGDTTPPTAAAEVTGEQDAEGNYLDAATVTVSATDNEGGSGIASTEYKLDDGAWTAYTAAVVVNTAGMHMLSYRATDVAGNVSEEGMAHFTIVENDTTAPVVSANVAGSQDPDGNYIDSAVVAVTAEDEGGSGVDTVEYKLDGGEWTAYTEAVQVNTAGAHEFAFRATDLAGNVSAESMVAFTVVEDPNEDTVPPSVSAVVTGNQDSNWNFVDSATINLSALDADSGVASVEYKLDDGAWTVYTDPVVVGDEGAHTLVYRATDNAGNVSAELTGSFTVVAATPADACRDSDTRATVVIDGEDTRVPNVDTGNGCTINDLIDEDADHVSHQAFVTYVKKITAELVEDGLLTTQQANRINKAASRSTVGL